MKATALTFSLLFASSLRSALAYTCDASNAENVDDPSTYFTDDPYDYTTDDSSYATKRAILPNTPRAPSTPSPAHALARHLLVRRSSSSSSSSQSDSIQCTPSQECLTATSTNNYLMCFDENTGDFSDNYGQSGNVYTGVFTEPGGQVTSYLPDGFLTGAGAGSAFAGGATDLGGSSSAGGDVTSLGGGGSGGSSSSVQTSLGQSTGGAVTATAGAGAGGTPSMATGSGAHGQPTGKVAGGGVAGQAGVDVVAAMGAFGLMAAMI